MLSNRKWFSKFCVLFPCPALESWNPTEITVYVFLLSTFTWFLFWVSIIVCQYACLLVLKLWYSMTYLNLCQKSIFHLYAFGVLSLWNSVMGLTHCLWILCSALSAEDRADLVNALKASNWGNLCLLFFRKKKRGKIIKVLFCVQKNGIHFVNVARMLKWDSLNFCDK